MTVRHLRVETPVLGYGWHDVVDLDDADPIVAALIGNGRLTTVAGTPGPAQTYHDTHVIYAATTPDVTQFGDGVVWVAPSGFSLLQAGAWTPLGGGGGAATTNAAALTSGILPAARIGDASIADAKLASGTSLTAAERTKLTGIAAGATVNATDAALRDRSTHTGTQAASTVTGLAAVATSGSYTDLTNKPTIPAAYTDEQAQDAIGVAIAAGTQSGISVTYDDAAGSLSFAATGTTSPDATTTSKGIVQLTGDLGGTAAAPTVPGLASKVGTGDARLSDARTPVDGSVTNVKVAPSAAISADKLADGTTLKVLTATERTKLTGIATGATANSTDAQLRDRSTHTGTQPATTITGLAAVATSGAYADLTGAPAGDTSSAMVTPTGADPTGVADSTTALQNAIASAISGGKELYIPAGTYKCSAALTASASTVYIRGAGAGKTTLSFTGSGYNLLTVGDGGGGQVRPTGHLRGISVRGPGVAPASGFAAVVINGLNQFQVSDVQTDNQDIGFDLINNCYGAMFTNIRSGFGGSCNVGVNLRTGPQSGSDITFLNPWVAGRIAGFYCAGGGGGYHIFGGQVAAGMGTVAVNDNAGAIVVGQDYLTSALGETSIDLHGVSFEGTMYAWIIRAFDQSVISAHGCYANPTQSASPAIGFYKHENHKNSRMTLSGTTISGYWSAASLVTLAGSYGNVAIFETGTYTAAQQPTIAGTPTFVASIAVQAGLSANAIVSAYNGLTIQGVTPASAARTITAGTGLTGGGDLSANRTLAVSYGSAAGTAVQGNDSRFTATTANTQTVAAYTLVLADAGKMIEMNNAAANTLTIPTNATVAFAVGTTIQVHQYGAGQTTIAPAAGVTLRAPSGAKLSAQYATASLRKRATDEWVVTGGSVAP